MVLESLFLTQVSDPCAQADQLLADFTCNVHLQLAFIGRQCQLPGSINDNECLITECSPLCEFQPATMNDTLILVRSSSALPSNHLS